MKTFTVDKEEWDRLIKDIGDGRRELPEPYNKPPFRVVCGDRWLTCNTIKCKMRRAWAVYIPRPARIRNLVVGAVLLAAALLVLFGLFAIAEEFVVLFTGGEFSLWPPVLLTAVTTLALLVVALLDRGAK